MDPDDKEAGHGSCSTVVLGICAMEKKAGSKPMRAILSRIEAMGDIQILHFPEETILEKPVEEWPHPVHVLISFFSDGFPLDKAEEYVKLRQPFCINDLTAQRVLFQRPSVYKLLAENGIPHPEAVFVERDPVTNALQGAAADNFVEADDFLEVGDTKVRKPFVEKPFDAEDHNVCIYFPSSAGGGVKRLFRKVGNQSSAYDQECCQVRRDGSYSYEPFLKTQGTDIKVYTVGPDYVHAEARKSPVVDGVVKRDKEGKEMRVPVVLTPVEKDIARRVCLAFGQFVCGFDLLRASAGSYVIDVNGWSFVKGAEKYYADAAKVIRSKILQVTRSVYLPSAPSAGNLAGMIAEDGEQASSSCLETQVHSQDSRRWEHEELLAVLAVMRHGDRTPKNKMKLRTSQREFLDLHRRWVKSTRDEAKLKTPKQLQEVLDMTKAMLGQDLGTSCSSDNEARLPNGALSTDERTLKDRGDPDGKASELEQALRLIAVVLEEGGRFDGIYRKVQLKPVAWSPEDQVTEILVVLKYGGVLTHAGIVQAETLGRQFRGEMYPGESTEADCSSGLLRLHATQRHDFKVYSSDEGRVQMSAAAFTRGLLDLDVDGSLTPICVALVETDPKMLDELPHNSELLLAEAKRLLFERIAGPDAPPGLHDLLQSIHQHVVAVVREIEVNMQTKDLTPMMRAYCKCQPLLKLSRWKKLDEDFWDAKRNQWNISKVPEIHDAVKFDLIHHSWLAPVALSLLYADAKKLNDLITPNEFGSDEISRVKIGARVCRRLLNKLSADLDKTVGISPDTAQLPKHQLVTAVQLLNRVNSFSKQITPEDGDAEAEQCKEAEFAGLDVRHALKIENPHRCVRTRLYFTSQSHIQTMVNVLRYCNIDGNRPAEDSSSQGHPLGEGGGIVCDEAEKRLNEEPVFDYLTQIVFRLYEDKLAATDSEERYRVEVLFSPGAIGHPSAADADDHAIPLAKLQPLHAAERPLTLKRLRQLLSRFTQKPKTADSWASNGHA